MSKEKTKKINTGYLITARLSNLCTFFFDRKLRLKQLLVNVVLMFYLQMSLILLKCLKPLSRKLKSSISP